MENNKKLGHLMVDIETMGTKSKSVILSLAAVEFDIETGETGQEFYEKIDFQTALDVGLEVSASTILWWLKQNEKARLELAEAKSKSIHQVLVEFSQFVKKVKPESGPLQVWGNSARFDLGLLDDAYRAIKIETPWVFWDERCVRTLVSFAPGIKKETVFKGDAHNALHDCHHQIEYCHKTWKHLKNK